jgi:hypothetical protein
MERRPVCGALRGLLWSLMRVVGEDGAEEVARCALGDWGLGRERSCTSDRYISHRGDG